MPSPVPTPVAAALGLVPTVLDGVRALPRKAVQLPVFAVSSVLTGLDRTRRGYDDLAQRGERLIAQLRGTSFDELEDELEDALQGTRLAAPYDKAEDALEDAAEAVTAFARNPRATVTQAARSARSSAGKGLEAVADSVEQLAEKTEDLAAKTEDLAEKTGGMAAKTEDLAEKTGGMAATASDDVAAAGSQSASPKAPGAASSGPTPAPESGKGRPTPKATEPDSTRVPTAASSEVVKTVERVSAVVGGPVPDHDELPLPDYDHLTLGALRGRMRSLDLPQLVQLRQYEQTKANRLPVVTMLDNRIAKLASDPTAPLSGGDVSGPSTKAASQASPTKGIKSGGSKVTPATAAATSTAPGVAHGGLGGEAPKRT